MVIKVRVSIIFTDSNLKLLVLLLNILLMRLLFIEVSPVVPWLKVVTCRIALLVISKSILTFPERQLLTLFLDYSEGGR